MRISPQNRDKNQIRSITEQFLLRDFLFLGSFVALVPLTIVSFLLDIPLWAKFLLPAAILGVFFGKILSALSLWGKLRRNQTFQVVLDRAHAEVVATSHSCGRKTIRYLRLEGLANGKKQTYYLYPLRAGLGRYEKIARRMNAHSHLSIDIIQGTHVIDNFFASSGGKSKKENAVYLNQDNGRKKHFHYRPEPCLSGTLFAWLRGIDLYDEVYLLKQGGLYVCVSGEVLDKDRDQRFQVGGKTFDSVTEAMDYLKETHYIDENEKAAVLCGFDGLPPRQFLIEAEGYLSED